MDIVPIYYPRVDSLNITRRPPFERSLYASGQVKKLIFINRKRKRKMVDRLLHTPLRVTRNNFNYIISVNQRYGKKPSLRFEQEEKDRNETKEVSLGIGE